ncbi:MAG: CBS domain-containing protein [Nitrospirae bacterium]|nr:CBS domain-containing protein [Nitrospirota bacterium]
MATRKKETPSKRPARKTAAARPGTEFERLTVARFMESDVQSAHEGTKADVIASMMIEGFGSVPIVDNRQRLVGVVSEYDLLASLERGHKWSDVTARDIMARNPYSIWPETNVAMLVHVLLKSDLIRAPVVDKDNTLVGIVARRDILRAYLNYGADKLMP